MTSDRDGIRIARRKLPRNGTDSFQICKLRARLVIIGQETDSRRAVRAGRIWDLMASLILLGYYDNGTRQGASRCKGNSIVTAVQRPLNRGSSYVGIIARTKSSEETRST